MSSKGSTSAVRAAGAAVAEPSKDDLEPGTIEAEQAEEQWLEDNEEEEEDAGWNEEGNAGFSKEDDMLQEDDTVNQFEEDQYESDSASDSGTDSLTWISWFCSLPGHEYFAEVGEDFIEDDFNLTGLNALVPFYKEALEMILDVEPQEDSLKIPDVSIVESSAELLYGLIHQRYILTRQGLQQMVEKYERGHFGFCPRVFCHSHPVLPCGRSDLPGLDTVKLFCANCIDNYAPPSSRFHGVDGAFFGTTFPHLLFQTYRELAPSPIAPVGTNYSSLNTQSNPPKSTNGTSLEAPTEASTASEAQALTSSERRASTSTAPGAPLTAPTLQKNLLGQRSPQARLYTPRIYGFRVSEQSKSGPRMRWMRMRPESFEELDQGIASTTSAKVPATATTTTAASASKVGNNNMAKGAPATHTEAAGVEGQDTTMASHPAHSVTSDGRSTATGRPMAGRAPSLTVPGPNL